MEELLIEEKAKRYDSMFERLKEMYNNNKTNVAVRLICERYFPELKECEDEMMIQYFKDLAPFDKAEELYEKYGFSHKDAIAWLEKQTEHANFRNKIQIGDKVTRNEDGVLVNLSQLNRVAKKHGEQKPIVNDNAKEMFIKALERVEEQNAKGYKLTDCDKKSWWEDFKTYTSCTVEQKSAWSEEDEAGLGDAMWAIEQAKTIARDENDMGNLWYAERWLKSIKDRVQPKQEWSEEDEANLNYLIDFCNGYYNGNKPVLSESTARSLSNWLYRLKSCEIMSNTNKIDNEEAEKTIHLACEFIRHHSRKGDSIGGIDCPALTERLKSLRPQTRWKPSEEQMEFLKKCIEAYNEVTFPTEVRVLSSLYNDLKKLKG